MRILYLTPPAKTSNEIDTYRQLPDVEVVAVDASGFDRGAEIRLPASAVPWLGSPERWTGALAWYRGLADLDLEGIDVVLSSELYSLSTVQAIRLARRLGALHVSVVWEILPESPLNHLPPWGLHRRYATRRTDHVLAFTEHAARYARQLGVAARDISVVHPGIDTSQYRPAPSLQKAPHVLFVGELRPDKGIADVVSACDRLAQSIGAHFRLRIAGDGELRADLERAATSRPWLEVLGRVPRADITSLLRSSRVLAIAPWSRRLWAEQFGFALVEAMACGLPVVATDCGAVREVVPDHNPVVSEHDIDGLARGIRAALGPDGEAWGRINRDLAVERFDLSRQAGRMRDVLAAVAARQGHA